MTKSLTTIARTMNNIQYSFRTNTSKILDIRGPNPLIRASSDHLAFPFQTFLPLPLGKNVLCHLSQPGIQLTSQHLAKYHKPRCVLTHVVHSIVALHVLSHFGNICQLECSEAVKRVHDNLWGCFVALTPRFWRPP